MSEATLTRTPNYVDVEAAATLAEDVEWLLGAGESLAVIARRLDTSPLALSRRFHRAGFRDLACRFEREAKLAQRSGRRCAA